MRLVKIQDGLLEQDDFFKVTPFSEFLGKFQYTRSDGIFTLKEGFIERRLEHENYVIVVEKENDILGQDDELYFYVREDYHRSGIIETKKDGLANVSFWKLIRHEGFIQSYTSSNGTSWSHRGGGEIGQTSVQGFQVEGNTELRLKNYSIYRNPYVTVHGFQEGQVAYIEDIDGNIMVERIFDADGAVELMLEHPLEGRIRVTNSMGVTFYESALMELKYGDAYVITDYRLELYYKGSLIEHKPTVLNTLKEIVVVKNVSDGVYENIQFKAIVPSTDTVTVSLNDVDYSEAVVLPSIEPLEEVPLYVQIVKDKSKINFGTRHFVLEVD